MATCARAADISSLCWSRAHAKDSEANGTTLGLLGSNPIRSLTRQPWEGSPR